MSRTFRRKNFELENQNSWHRAGSKTCQTYRERIAPFMSCVFREPTEAEYNYKYWRTHADTRMFDSCRLSKRKRQIMEGQLRARNRQLMHRAEPEELLLVAHPTELYSIWWIL